VTRAEAVRIEAIAFVGHALDKPSFAPHDDEVCGGAGMTAIRGLPIIMTELGAGRCAFTGHLIVPERFVSGIRFVEGAAG
jgi:hypothetical protein